jgi:hypothetical protein
LPSFCRCFANDFPDGRTTRVSELNISTYIRIMQSGLMQNKAQEAAGRLLLEAIVNQPNAFVSTDLNAKKISRLVNQKDSVPDDIQAASVKDDVVKGVYEYFEKKVIPDLNPVLKFDTLEKLKNVVEQDTEISQHKRGELIEFYGNKDMLKFLVELFLYVLNRPNKKSDESVGYQDIPFLDEANYECPISHEKLVENVKGTTRRRYTITQIFPSGLSDEKKNDFSAICAIPKDFDSYDNLIALNERVSEEYLLEPTIEEFKNLREIKQKLTRNYNAKKAIGRIELEEEIRIVLVALMDISSSDGLEELAYEALRIDEKIPDNYILKNEVQHHVLHFYRYIEGVFSESEGSFDIIASEVKLCSQNLEKTGMSQEDVIYNLSEWIKNKVKLGEPSRLACEIVVSFFIQNCEVFKK